MNFPETNNFRSLADQATNSQSSQTEILDIKQAADFVKLKVTTLYEKTSQRNIPYLKKRNKLYFNRIAFTEWVNRSKIKTIKEIESEATDYLVLRKPKKRR